MAEPEIALRRAAAVLALAASSLGGMVPARSAPTAEAADAPGHVRLRLPHCRRAPFEASAFLDLLHVELQSDGVDRIDVSTPESPSGPPALARVRMEFEPCARRPRALAIDIDDAVTHKRVARVISVRDIAAEARPRALALAVAELLRASWVELALPAGSAPAFLAPEAVRRSVIARFAPAEAGAMKPGPAEAPQPASAPIQTGPSVTEEPSPVAQPAPRSGEVPGNVGAPERSSPTIPAPAPATALTGAGRSDRVSGGPASLPQVRTEIELRSFPQSSTSLVGGGVALSALQVGVFRVRLGAALLSGLVDHPLGQISLAAALGNVGMLAGLRFPRISIEAGPRIDAGWAWIRGRPSVPEATVGHSGGAPAVHICLGGGLWFLLGESLWIGTAIDAGAVAAGVEAHANGSRAAGINGFLIAGRAGLAFDLQ